VIERKNTTNLAIEEAHSPQIAKASPPKRQFAPMMQDAVDLLNYALQAGIEIDTGLANQILGAMSDGGAVWDKREAGKVAAAIAKLAAKVKPVTAETLRASRDDARRAITHYRAAVFSLVAFTIPLTLISYIPTEIAAKINADIYSVDAYLLIGKRRLMDRLRPLNRHRHPRYLRDYNDLRSIYEVYFINQDNLILLRHKRLRLI
jgi:hypothetical protein